MLVPPPEEPATLARRAGPRPSAAARPSFRQALAVPAYRAALAANFAVGFSVLGVRSTLVPLLVVEHLRLARGWVGVAFLVSAVAETALLLPAGRAVDTLGRRPALTAAGGGRGSPSWCCPSSAARPAWCSRWRCSAPAARCWAWPRQRSWATSCRAAAAPPIAVWQMASDLGAIIGPLTAGVLVDRGSYPLALLTCALVVGTAALTGLLVPAGRPARPAH